MNKLLDIYSDYLIAQNQYATAVGISDLLEGRISHDKITRFLNGEELASKELWEYVKPELRKIEEDRGGVLIIDDTIEEKTYTDEYDMKKKFVFGIKANRLIALSEEDRKKGQYQNLNTLQLKDREKRIVWLKDVSFPVALITKIFKNEDGSTGILYLITNDLESSADRIYEVYQKRWRIEEYHKSIKQNTSLEKSPTKVVRSQKNHIFASIVAYCKLEFLKTKTSLSHFGIKYMLLMKANRAAFLELERWWFNQGVF